jgi:CHASE2 domain-containing sensor protein
MIVRLVKKLRDPFVKDKHGTVSPANGQSNGLVVQNNTLIGILLVVATSMGVTALMVGMRHNQLLQPLELGAYDQMLRLRSVNPLDDRLLLVTVKQADIQRENFPLPDATINKLLVKLESYRPRVIGLGINRSQQKNFADGVVNKANIISVCKFSSPNTEEIPPPPNVSIKTVGFNDLMSDDSDRIVRRSLLFADSQQDKKCKARYSFAALLALNYLEKQGIHQSFPDGNWVLGKKVLPPLQKSSGGYESMDAGGYQITIDYRHPDVARQVTLSEVLDSKVDPNWVKDKLVIVGNAATSIDRGVYTPYSAIPRQPITRFPLFIHAQVASQILSTVLDGKPLIWYWSDNAEITWMWIWDFGVGNTQSSIISRCFQYKSLRVGGNLLFVIFTSWVDTCGSPCFSIRYDWR